MALPIPPTISPRVDCEKYKPEPRSATSGPKNGLSGSLAQISWRCGLVGKSMPMALDEMKRAGITKAMVIGRRAQPPFENVPNEDVLSFVRDYPDNFFAVPALEPTDRSAALDELEFLHTQPSVKAIHLEPGWAARPMYADDANLYSIYERLEKIGMPTLVSAGGTIGPDFGYVDPKHLHRVAKDFPKLKLIIGHGGWPYG